MSETVTDTADWGIIHRITTDDGETRRLRLRIRDVPDGKGRDAIKRALERAGRVFGEGAVPWGNHCVLPRDRWLDLDAEPVEALTFADLVDEAGGEKRITVRLPIGLYAQLTKAVGAKSFNRFVTDTLAEAIGYRDEPIDESLPRLAAKQGIGVEEMREKIAAMAANTPDSPFARQFGEYLAKLATLPPEQLKARSDALSASPEWAEAMAVHERMASGEDILAEATDAEIADGAAKLGMTPEQFRETMKMLAVKMKDIDFAALQTGRAGRTAQDVKDTTLMLRDVFTGAGQVAE